MKHLITLVSLIASLGLVSCQSTGDNAQIKDLAAIGRAYITSSGSVSPANQAYVDLAFEVASTGKVDQDKLIALAQAKLGDKVSDAQAQQITALITQLRAGKLDKAALLSLGEQAVSAYAMTQGIPPEQSAAVLALARLFLARAS